MSDLIDRQAVHYYIEAHIHEIITESGIDKNGHTNKILRALVNGVDTMPSVTPTDQWVSVKDRLPEEYAYVLACTDKEEIFIANYLGKMNDGTDCFDDDDGMMWEGDVIAWMPLPKPYEPQERNEDDGSD